MYKFAQSIVRHKVGVVAVLAFTVFVFSGKKEEAPQNASPWAKQEAAALANKSEDTFTDKLGNVAVKAGDFAAEQVLGDKDLNPVKLGKDAVNNMSDTADAMTKANAD